MASLYTKNSHILEVKSHSKMLRRDIFGEKLRLKQLYKVRHDLKLPSRVNGSAKLAGVISRTIKDVDRLLPQK